VSSKPRWFASNELDTAFAVARACHANKARKTDSTPYISHLMGVSALVVEHGGTEVQAAGALLHDVIEDTSMTHDRLVTLVGQAVADIVLDCTDSTERKRDDHMTPEEKLADWRERKEKYLTKLAAKADGAPSLLVVLADKVHNGEQTARDIERCRAEGRSLNDFWSMFNAPREQQQWWYGELLAKLSAKTWSPEALPLLARFSRAVSTIQSA
jgi:(p)ppGpp synthase/HD superfamily hydrolase